MKNIDFVNPVSHTNATELGGTLFLYMQSSSSVDISYDIDNNKYNYNFGSNMELSMFPRHGN